MKEEKALAILLANLKGAKEKRSDLLDIAEAARTLHEEYGTYDKVAERVGVSKTMIQQFDKIAGLTESVKDMIRQGKLGRHAIDKAYRLSQLLPETQIALAKVVADLPEKDMRDIITYAKRFPNLPASEYRKRILEAKTVTSEKHLIMCLVDDETYSRLRSSAKEKGLSVERLVKEYIGKGLGAPK